MKIMLNLGCGAIRPDGWINTDSSLNSLIQDIPILGKTLSSIFSDTVYIGKAKYMNLNNKWNFPDESVDVIYASHLFEHLSSQNARLFLTESYRTLKKGGVIRLVVPDLYQHIQYYVERFDIDREKASHHLLSMLNLHREGQYNSSLMHTILGRIQGFPHQHKYMYDQHSLTELLTQFGFTKLSGSSYGRSNYLFEIDDIESSTLHGYEKSLYIEGVK